MIVVLIVGMLAAIALPAFMKSRQRSQNAAVINDFRTFESAFVQFAVTTGNWPPDSHVVLPGGMDEYIDNGDWLGRTPIGGEYNWEGPDNYAYAGIAIMDYTVPTEQLVEMDSVVDDGDLATGLLRITSNGRLTWIIEE